MLFLLVPGTLPHSQTIMGLGLLASVGGIVSCLFLVGAMRCHAANRLCSQICEFFSAILLGASMLPGLL